MHFEPVWISSAEHLAKFQSVLQGTPWWMQAIERYNLPDEFPCIQMGYKFFSFRMPTIVLCHGQLDIEVDEQLLRFQSTLWDIPAGKRLNLLSTWNFELKSSDIISIEKFEKPSSKLRYYDMNFARVHTHLEGLLGDFLLCAGEAFPSIDEARRCSEQIYGQLLKLS